MKLFLQFSFRLVMDDQIEFETKARKQNNFFSKLFNFWLVEIEEREKLSVIHWLSCLCEDDFNREIKEGEREKGGGSKLIEYFKSAWNGKKNVPCNVISARMFNGSTMTAMVCFRRISP